MNHTRFPEGEASLRETQQTTGQSTEVGFMPHQHNGLLEPFNQIAELASRPEALIQAERGRQTDLLGDGGRLSGPEQGAADQPIQLQAPTHKGFQHSPGTLTASLCQLPVGMVKARNPRLGDAMAQQQQLNRGRGGHGTARLARSA